MNQSSSMKASYCELDHLSEEEMILKAKENPKAFETLYVKYFEEIYNYLRRRLNQEQIVFDICQNTFKKALLKIHQFEYRGLPFSSWLYRIAQNELNQHFRKNARNRVISIDDSGLQPTAPESPNNTIDKDQLIQALVEELNQLKGDDLAIIEMHYFEGKSYKEIAILLDISEGNAKVKAHRIKERIKKRLNHSKSTILYSKQLKIERISADSNDFLEINNVEHFLYRETYSELETNEENDRLKPSYKKKKNQDESSINANSLWNFNKTNQPPANTFTAHFRLPKGTVIKNIIGLITQRDKNSIKQVLVSNKTQLGLDLKGDYIVWLILPNNKIAVVRQTDLTQIQEYDNRKEFILEIINEDQIKAFTLKKVLTFI